MANEFMTDLIWKVRYLKEIARKENMSAEEAIEQLGFQICTMIDGTGENLYDVALRIYGDEDDVYESKTQDVDHDVYYPMLRERKQ